MKKLRNRGMQLLGSWFGTPDKFRGDDRPRGLLVESLESRVVLATFTWTGANGTNWNDAANWVPNAIPGANDELVFSDDVPGLNSFTSVNDIVGLTLTNITIDNDSGTPFEISGNAISVNGTISHTGGATGDTIDFASITLAGDSEISDTGTGTTVLVVSSDIVLGAFDLTLSGTATGTTLSGNISGTGGLIKNGAGSFILSGTNAYTGGTTVSAGTLEGTTTSLQGDITNNATVVFDQGVAGNYSDTISGTGAVFKRGIGVLTFDGTNTYTGGTTIEVGTLTITGGTALANTGTVTVNGTGAFFVNDSESIGALAGTSSTAVVSIAAGQILSTGGNNASTSYAGTITGEGGLTKTGAGNQTIGGAVDYEGLTTISGGTLTFGGDTAGLIGNITVNAALAFAQSADSSFNQQINGTGSVTQAGTAVLTINSADNTYSGATTISSGTLVATGGNAIGDLSAVSVNGTGTLRIDQDETVASTQAQLDQAAIILNATLTTNENNASTIINVVISGPGRLVKEGTGTLLLTQMNTYSGGTEVNGGTLIGSHESLQGNIENEAAVTFLQPFNGTFAGVISGSGTVTKGDSGVLTFSNNNTYTGLTTITGGTLAVDGSIASDVNIAGGALAGTGTVGGNVTAAAGAIIAPGNPASNTRGDLVTGSIDTSTGSQLQFTINGATAGTFDQLVVNGTVDITGSILAINPASDAPSGQTVIIVQNDGTDAVIGTFNGLEEGEFFSAGNFVYRISYVGGDGNDIALEAFAVAEPTFFDGILRVFGTGGNDQIIVTQTSRLGFNGASVTVNGELFGPFNNIKQIQIYALEGDDDIIFTNDVRIPMWIDGGSGTDTLDFSAVNFALTTYVGPGIHIPEEASKFEEIEAILGTAVNDNFIIGSEGVQPGTLDGGGGTNTIDLSRVDQAVSVNLQTGQVNGLMDIRNFQIVFTPLFFQSTVTLPSGQSLTSFGGRGQVLGAGGTQYRTTPNLQGASLTPPTIERDERSESSSSELVTLDSVFEAEAKRLADEEAAKRRGETAEDESEINPDAVDAAVEEEGEAVVAGS